MGIYLDGSDGPDRAVDGSLLIDDDFYLMVNAWWGPLTFTIPDVRTPANGAAPPWRAELSTYDGIPPATASPSGPTALPRPPGPPSSPALSSPSAPAPSPSSAASGVSSDPAAPADHGRCGQPMVEITKDYLF